jgi:ABC-2 type transport system permease protein
LTDGRPTDFLRCAFLTLKAYLTSDLIRSKGFLFALLGIAMWLVLFVLPMIFFASEGQDRSVIAAYIFSGLVVFNLYMIATWDLGWEVRLLINQGVMDYIILTGRNPLIIYFGLVPLSLIWIMIIVTIGYGIVTAFIAPPKIMIVSPTELLLASALLMIVILGYALILASITMTAGTSGFIMELISWVLPIATGGFTPLSSLPWFMRTFALLTPFSYPAEALRYSIGVSEALISPGFIFTVGYIYAVIFFAGGLLAFRLSLNRVLREGFKTIASW